MGAIMLSHYNSLRLTGNKIFKSTAILASYWAEFLCLHSEFIMMYDVSDDIVLHTADFDDLKCIPNKITKFINSHNHLNIYKISHHWSLHKLFFLENLFPLLNYFGINFYSLFAVILIAENKHIFWNGLDCKNNGNFFWYCFLLLLIIHHTQTKNVFLEIPCIFSYIFSAASSTSSSSSSLSSSKFYESQIIQIIG